MISIEGLNDDELYKIAKKEIDEAMNHRAKLERDKKPFLDEINELILSKNELKQIKEELDNVVSFISVLNEKIELIDITRESPDCIIKQDNREIGVEVKDLVLNQKSKEVESIFDAILSEIQNELSENTLLKGHYTVKFISLITSLKQKVKNQIKSEIKKLILGKIGLDESTYVDNLYMTEHSSLYLNRDIAGYVSGSLSQNYFFKYIEDKESKIENYRRNSSLKEVWLLLVKYSKPSSDFAYLTDSKNDIFGKSKFDRIYIFDAFNKEILQLK